MPDRNRPRPQGALLRRVDEMFTKAEPPPAHAILTEIASRLIAAEVRLAGLEARPKGGPGGRMVDPRGRPTIPTGAGGSTPRPEPLCQLRRPRRRPLPGQLRPLPCGASRATPGGPVPAGRRRDQPRPRGRAAGGRAVLPVRRRSRHRVVPVRRLPAGSPWRARRAAGASKPALPVW